MPVPSSDSTHANGSARSLVRGGAEPPSEQNSAWISREVQALASAWSRGERVRAEDLLACHPGLGDEAAIRLIYEEVCLRRESGEDLATTEVVNRFPRWKDELEVLLGCDRMLRPFTRVLLFPSPGEDLGPFRLLAELGRGASGKTYLAAEPALLDRLVVLKVISDDQQEHLSLARLRHTHIIPLFSEQTFPERGYRALCMPYLGGTSLARILEWVSAIQPSARRGRHLLDALDRAQAGREPIAAGDGPYRLYLAQSTYIQAVCWIAACLAEGLQSAHAHGLIHMDVKPSNVLIAADGLPLLLDFHLAHRPISAGEFVADRLGGTPGWMAPEHRAALDAVGRGRAISAGVDHRADLYSLGLLLREALAGPGAAQGQNGAQPLRRLNPEVSVGLADIVQRCVASRPADRYPTAAALADDLRRHLSDLPLRNVPNRSLAERWRKWRRRRPAALLYGAALLTIFSALTVVTAIGFVFYRERVQAIQAALDDGSKLRAQGRFPEAIHTLHRGLHDSAAVPAVDRLRGSLDKQLQLARRGQKAAALHQLADLVRFRHGVDLPSAEEARTLIQSIVAIWKERDLLLAPAPEILDPTTERVIRTDLLDLAIACVELRLGLAPPAEADAARRDALLLIDQANDACGPSSRLDRLRRSAAGKPVDADYLDEEASGSFRAVDHYDLGRSRLRAGRFREACVEFQRVLDERPQDFWPNFYQGICAYRLGQFHDSLAAFRTCIALAPRSAECFYNRALAAVAVGRIDDAVRDYGRALELDPALWSASLNRGILAFTNGRNDEAIADFRQALENAPDERSSGLIHYNLALAHAARRDRNRALSSAREALNHGHAAARDLATELGRDR
jgi:serine/threonine protein kinase/Flp pilus assembly protein TadD